MAQPIPEAESADRFRRRDALRFAAIIGVLAAFLVVVLGSDILQPGVTIRAGDIAAEPIRAPRAITFPSTLDTEAARISARDLVPPQYDYDAATAETIVHDQLSTLDEVAAPVDAAFTAPISDQARRQALGSVLPDLGAASRAVLVDLTSARWKTIRSEAQRVLGQVERAELRDTDLASERRLLVSRFEGDLTTAERELAAEIVGPLLVANSSYSESRTQEERARAAQAVEPVTTTIRQGETIVDQYHQVTERDMEKIVALGLDEQRPDVARLGGWILLATVLAVLLVAWIWRFRRELWHRTNILVMVGLILVAAVVAVKLSAGRSILPFFLPVAAVGMLLAVLLDAGFAVIVTAILAVLAGAVNDSSLEMTAYVFLGGFAGILVVRRGDRLQAFVQAGIAVTLVNASVVTIFALFGGRDLTGLLQLWAASAVSGLGSAVLAAGSFAVFGNLFGILTVFQMLELANPSQPLLRRLLVETPGTYHHSIMVGNLAERAAEAIGADPLLARLAAYYHDIGKLSNPLAFIENQGGGTNVHDELAPEVSAAILRQHVPDGIETAYRAKLPKPLIAFIPQHHGTALMSYFYAKAREQAAAEHGGLGTPAGLAAADAVDQRKFRHVGPKPQSREAATLMLADGVEASVRSLASQDETAIRAMVSRIISERLTDGQFDECDLMLRDLEQIREAFVEQLIGMYHRRIEYPQNKVVELEARRNTGTQG